MGRCHMHLSVGYTVDRNCEPLNNRCVSITLTTAMCVCELSCIGLPCMFSLIDIQKVSFAVSSPILMRACSVC